MPFRQLLTKISNTTLNERSVVIVTAVLVFSMIMDMELSNLADILQKRISSPIGIFTYVVISGVYLSVQYLLLRYSKQITSDLRSRKKDVNYIETIVSILHLRLEVFRNPRREAPYNGRKTGQLIDINYSAYMYTWPHGTKLGNFNICIRYCGYCWYNIHSKYFSQKV